MARDHSSASHSNKNDPASVLEKPTKPRLPAARMTLNEMKRRVNGISEYITRTQIEMASSRQSDIYAYLAWMEEKGTPVSNSTTSSTTPNDPAPNDAVPKIQINGTTGAATNSVLEKASEALSSSTAAQLANAGALDIMEMLSSKINRWQQHYGERV
jgi:hypothetical protein